MWILIVFLPNNNIILRRAGTLFILITPSRTVPETQEELNKYLLDE